MFNIPQNCYTKNRVPFFFELIISLFQKGIKFNTEKTLHSTGLVPLGFGFFGAQSTFLRKILLVQ
jgi:hypothetical protein